MDSAKNNLIPYNLLSNFLTHTYLEILEQLCRHGDYHIDEDDSSAELIQSLKSFLFIFQNNTYNTTLLQQHIFDFFEPYVYLTKSEIIATESHTNPEGARIFSTSKRSLNPHTLRKIYTKNILSIKKHHDYELWRNCNIAFLHIHRKLVYHRFKEESSVPELLLADNAARFVTCIWRYYLSHLITTQNFDYLLDSIDEIQNSSLTDSQELLNYIKEGLLPLTTSDSILNLLKRLP